LLARPGSHGPRTRRILLPEISGCAAACRTDSDLDELKRVVFESPDMPLEEKDWRVHNLIARASGNVLFVVLLNAFTQMTRASSLRYFEVEANRRRSMAFHRDIYAAIERGDASKARKVMRDVMHFAEIQTLRAASIPGVPMTRGSSHDDETVLPR